MEFQTIAQQLYPLSTEAYAALAALVERVPVAKNKSLMAAGEVHRYIYFIESGLFRIYYHKEELEVVLAFAFPGESLLSFESYVSQHKGYEHMQALEESMLYRIPIKDLQALYHQQVDIANWGRKLAEYEMIKTENRLMDKLFKTAAEAYHDLLQKEPQITNRIKLGYIASYLGVSQVTLSRIRAQKK